MYRLIIFLLLSTYIVSAQDKPLFQETAPSGRTLWKVSLFSLAATNALDVHSSWGKHELNPVLAGSNGTFGAHSALIKLGIQGGLMGMEYLLTRGHPTGKLYRALAIVNFGASAGFGAIAVHNYGIRR